MIQFKDISIPKPCSVDYDALPGNDVKRFCGSCNKHVYDFRGKDEAYLNEVFRATRKVCGIFYADQIQSHSLKAQTPFYYTIATKLLTIGLFLKTVLTMQDTYAINTNTQQTIQTIQDSTALKVKFKNPPYLPSNFKINVFINNRMHQSTISPENGFIYLPDSIQENDEIKVIVLKTKSLVLNGNKQTTYKVRKRTYVFLFKEISNIVIKINNRKQFKLIRRKETMGVMVGYW